MHHLVCIVANQQRVLHGMLSMISRLVAGVRSREDSCLAEPSRQRVRLTGVLYLPFVVAHFMVHFQSAASMYGVGIPTPSICGWQQP